MIKKKEKKITKKQDKKNKLFLSILFILLLLAIFAVLISSNYQITQNNKNENNLKNQTIMTGTNETEKIPIIKSNIINSSSSLDDFYGKPSFIVFAGTYCSHCKTLVPEIEKKIWNRYNLEVNIWINVIDGEKGSKFNVNNIPQGYNPNLKYDELISNCRYVPAYVVLDKNGREILKSCGSEKTIEEVINVLEKEIN